MTDSRSPNARADRNFLSTLHSSTASSSARGADGNLTAHVADIAGNGITASAQPPSVEVAANATLVDPVLTANGTSSAALPQRTPAARNAASSTSPITTSLPHASVSTPNAPLATVHPTIGHSSTLSLSSSSPAPRNAPPLREVDVVESEDSTGVGSMDSTVYSYPEAESKYEGCCECAAKAGSRARTVCGLSQPHCSCAQRGGCVPGQGCDPARCESILYSTTAGRSSRSTRTPAKTASDLEYQAVVESADLTGVVGSKEALKEQQRTMSHTQQQHRKRARVAKIKRKTSSSNSATHVSLQSSSEEADSSAMDEEAKTDEDEVTANMEGESAAPLAVVEGEENGDGDSDDSDNVNGSGSRHKKKTARDRDIELRMAATIESASLAPPTGAVVSHQEITCASSASSPSAMLSATDAAVENEASRLTGEEAAAADLIAEAVQQSQPAPHTPTQPLDTNPSTPARTQGRGSTSHLLAGQPWSEIVEDDDQEEAAVEEDASKEVTSEAVASEQEELQLNWSEVTQELQAMREYVRSQDVITSAVQEQLRVVQREREALQTQVDSLTASQQRTEARLTAVEQVVRQRQAQQSRQGAASGGGTAAVAPPAREWPSRAPPTQHGAGPQSHLSSQPPPSSSPFSPQLQRPPPQSSSPAAQQSLLSAPSPPSWADRVRSDHANVGFLVFGARGSGPPADAAAGEVTARNMATQQPVFCMQYPLYLRLSGIGARFETRHKQQVGSIILNWMLFHSMEGYRALNRVGQNLAIEKVAAKVVASEVLPGDLNAKQNNARIFFSDRASRDQVLQAVAARPSLLVSYRVHARTEDDSKRTMQLSATPFSPITASPPTFRPIPPAPAPTAAPSSRVAQGGSAQPAAVDLMVEPVPAVDSAMAVEADAPTGIRAREAAASTEAAQGNGLPWQQVGNKHKRQQPAMHPSRQAALLAQGVAYQQQSVDHPAQQAMESGLLLLRQAFAAVMQTASLKGAAATPAVVAGAAVESTQQDFQLPPTSLVPGGSGIVV